MKAGQIPYQHNKENEEDWNPIEIRQVKTNSVEEINRLTKDLNENLRRYVSPKKTPVQQVQQIVQQTTPVAEPQVQEWDESVLHNSNLVVGDKVKRFNFIDTDGAKFQVDSQLVTGKQQANVKVLVKTPQIMKGIVYVNQLPLDPSLRPNGTPTSELFRWDGFFITPEYCYYGWYVYQIIEHNWGLSDKDNFILQDVDRHSYDYTGLDDVEAYKSRFPNQTGKWDIEGLDSNRIIVRAMYRPDMSSVYGQEITPTLDFIDEPNRIIRTNIILHFTILKGE